MVPLKTSIWADGRRQTMREPDNDKALCHAGAQLLANMCSGSLPFIERAPDCHKAKPNKARHAVAAWRWPGESDSAATTPESRPIRSLHALLDYKYIYVRATTWITNAVVDTVHDTSCRPAQWCDNAACGFCLSARPAACRMVFWEVRSASIPAPTQQWEVSTRPMPPKRRSVEWRRVVA